MSANAPSFEIRPMVRGELDLVIEWAASENWNPGLHDADAFWAADPSGFWIGLFDGQPVAAVSAVKYSRDYGFMGLYIVRPDLRGCGHGLAIAQQAMAYLEGCNIGLDGVVEQQENYRKSGFVVAHRNVRYVLNAPAFASSEPDDRLVPLSGLPFEDVARYDRQFFPADRSAFLRKWIAQLGATAIGFCEEARLLGYGVLRPCRSGFKIGPMFAETPEIAASLLTRLIASARPGEQVFLDVPECNPRALDLALRFGMDATFETARMYTRGAPDIGMDKTYGITTFELG